MNPKTKVRVKRARSVQLFLRVCALLGALGAVFCVILINKTSSAVGWIIRVGPAVALCHVLYAVTHLCRGAASRPPASTASYMFFAGILDIGLIPFFAFSAVMANSDYTTNVYGWSTLFADDDASHKLIYAFYLISVVEAGLFAVSLGLDVYLTIVFRKIAKMPPDMNPLEDNLTARPSGKHKRNKSEMVFEKHLSASTLASQRMSTMSEDNLISNKRIPFTHTRTDSADRVTLYGNNKAFDSRVSLRNDINEAQNDPYRHSMAASQHSLSPSRPSSAITPAANARSPGAGLDHKPVRSSGLASKPAGRPASWLSYVDYEGVPTPLSDTASQNLDVEIRPLSPVSLMSDRDTSPRRAGHESVSSLPGAERAQEFLQNWYQASDKRSQQSQINLPFNDSNEHVHDQENNLSAPPPYAPGQAKKRSRDPLGMHPPTPVRERASDDNSEGYKQHLEPPSYATPQRQALQDVHVNSSGRPSMGSRPSSFVGSGGKTRYYGNLRTSLAGSPTRTPNPEHHYDSDEDMNQRRTRTMDSEDSGNFRVYDSDEESHHDTELHPVDRQTHAIMLGKPIETEDWNGPRKVSNSTGYDLKTGYAGLGSEFGLGMARRREVSGKVAEEGRSAGYGGIGMPEEKVGAVITGQGQRGGAAGWARFKGL